MEWIKATRSITSEPPVHINWEDQDEPSSEEEDMPESDNTSMLSNAPTGAMHILRTESGPSRRIINPKTKRFNKLPEAMTDTVTLGDMIITKNQMEEMYDQHNNPYKQM